MAEMVFYLEDDQAMAASLTEFLTSFGYSVEHHANIASALASVTLATDVNANKINAATSKHVDLFLLDVGLPDGSGFEFAEKIRNTMPEIPIVFLTARTDPEDRVRGLELGAEDYILKPFHLKELQLRLKRILDRSNRLRDESSEKAIQIGKANVYFSKFYLMVGDDRHTLSQKECALLFLLFQKKGDVVSRDLILDEVWSPDEFPTTRTVDNVIVRLRRLVEVNPENPKVILSVRGIGYQLVS